MCEPLFNARQTSLDKQQAVQEKLALLACYREGINCLSYELQQIGEECHILVRRHRAGQ